jgi:hypothetical protein
MYPLIVIAAPFKPVIPIYHCKILLIEHDQISDFDRAVCLLWLLRYQDEMLWD